MQAARTAATAQLTDEKASSLLWTAEGGEWIVARESGMNVDFEDDGMEELVVAYCDGDLSDASSGPAYQIEVWRYEGGSIDLLRRLLFGWWEQIWATRLAGVPKLLIAEARNFPAVAQYYHDAVLVRGRGLLRTLLQRGIERGEFRALDLETAIDVIYAPLMMLVVWRSSMGFCGKETDPAAYLKTHFDLLVQGLCQPKGLA